MAHRDLYAPQPRPDGTDPIPDQLAEWLAGCAEWLAACTHERGSTSARGTTVADEEAKRRGRVETVRGVHDAYPHRPWVTWRVYLDGIYLGDASSEDEGWRWIDDMLDDPEWMRTLL